MRNARILMILGIWIAVLPYLGFPNFWKNILFNLTGLGLVGFSYLLYKDFKKSTDQKEDFDNFTENSHFKETGMETEM